MFPDIAQLTTMITYLWLTAAGILITTIIIAVTLITLTRRMK